MDGRPIDPAPLAAATATAPVAATMGSAPATPRGVTLLDRQARPAAPRADEHEVLPAEDGPSDAQGRFSRVGVVRREGLKYPLLRRIEDLRADGRGGIDRLGVHEAVADHLLLTVRDPLARTGIARVLPPGCHVMHVIPGTPVVMVAIPAATLADYDAARTALAALPGVAHAGPDWLVQAAVTPDDPSFAQQWALDNRGQDGGTPDADIDAPEAWAWGTGSRTVKVGVIDTGIDLQHPDLAANIWTNPGEIPSNGIDDDGDGYIDDVHGWNFVADTANPQDDNFHGTHVSGTIGACGGNGVGVTGVCWQVTLVPLKFLDANGSGYTSDAVAAVYYANAIGCDLTSNSWGGGGFDQTLKDAIDAAGAQGHLFVAAAGNDGSDLGSYPSYPASYACPNLIAVAASDHSDALAAFSNYNSTAVHIAAPGVSILSTLPTTQTAAMASHSLTPGYGSISGTSMAAPHVSGALALLKATQPGLDATALRDRLMQRSDALAGLVGKVAGARRLNLRQLLDPAWTPAPPILALTATAMTEIQGNGDGFPGPGETLRLVPSFINLGGVDPGQCTITAIAASSGVTVQPPASGTIAALPPLITVAGPATTVAFAAGLADGQGIDVDFAVSSAAGTLGTFRWHSAVAAPPPRAEVATSFGLGEMVADPARPLVYIIDKSTPAILALNTQTGRLAARTILAGPPNVDPPTENGSFTSGLPAVSSDGGTLYVCLTRAGLIQCLSLPGLQTIRTLSCQGWLPFSAATGSDGALYVSSHDYWGPIRKLDPVSGAVLATFQGGQWGSYYMHALLRTNVQHTRLFVSETGLRVEGGPGYADEFDVTGATPTLVKHHPYQQTYLADYAIDEIGGRLLTTCGGIYGVQVTDMASGAYGTVWPFGKPYATAVKLLPNDPSIYGSSGSYYTATICRFDRASGTMNAQYGLNGTYSLPQRGFVLSSDRRMVYGMLYWRGDGGGFEGYNCLLGILGSPTLVLDNYPRAVGTLTPATGPPGVTITANASASYDPDAGGGIASYRWSFGDGATATTAVASHSYPTRGSYTVTLDVTDVEGLADRKTFTVVVNGPPIPQPQSVTTLEDTAKAITLGASDPEGDAITYSIATYPGKGSLSGTAPNLVYTPSINQNGSDSFTFRASDGLSSATATVTIAITPVNDPPLVSDRSLLTKVGTALPIFLIATDPDSSSLTYQVVQAPANGTLFGTAPNLTYTPAAGWAGLDSLRYTASDGSLTSGTATVTIRVNNPPVVQAMAVAVALNTPTPFVLAGSDADGQALTFRVTINPTHGTVSGSAPNLVYTPNSGETGSDSLSFVANDGYHDSAPAVVAFAITAPNPWPEADLAASTPVGSCAFTPLGSVFAVKGTGDLATAGDGGHFTWTSLPADGLIAARMTAITAGRGGVMLRSTTAPSAACAALVLGSAGRLELVVRTADGQPPATTDLGAQTAPCWLRLQRTATGVDAARSADGRTWTALASAAVTMPAAALAGVWGGGIPGPAQVTADQVRTHHSLDRTWQTAGGSAARTGVVPGAFAGTPFSLLWQKAPGGNLNPVSVGNGQVFLTQWLYSTSGWIKAFDLATGVERWSWPTTSAYSVNPPAFAEGRVFVQRCNNSSDSQVWCLSAATGAPLWKVPFGAQWDRYQAGCPAYGSIHVDGGTYGGMYGFDQVDGTQRYYVSLAQYDLWAPAFANGQLFSWAAGVVKAHDPATGAAAWSLDCGWTWNGYDMNTVPVISGTSLALRANGALHLVDTGTHLRRWMINAAFSGSPAVTADTVYALVGNQVNAYSLANGALLGSYNAGSALLDQPLVTDDSLIVASATGAWVLDRASLALRQALPYGGHPALAGRTLVLADPAGYLRACAAPPPNLPPIAQAQTLATVEDTPLALTLTGSDPEGQALGFHVTTPPAHGSLVGTPPSLSYVPQADWNGSDAFAFTVSDGQASSAPATVAIAIAAVNDRPVFTAGPDEIADGDGQPVAILAWATGFVAGPPDEAGQHPAYSVAVDRPELFAAAPAIAPDGSLSFTPAAGGAGTATLTVTCRDDGGTALGGSDTSLPATAHLAIRSIWDAELVNEQMVTVTLVATDALANESGDPGHALLSRSGPTGTDLTVGLTYGGSAGNGSDVRRIPDRITIPAGQAAVDIPVVPLQDGLAEGNETVVLSIAPGPGYVQVAGTSQQATIAIVDDEPVTVNVSASDASMAEPADNGRFTVSRTGDPAAALTVQLATGGTATPGQDCAALPSSVTIPAGATSVDIAVAVIDDAVAEERETVILSVLPGAGYQVGTAQATATIADDEPEAIAIEATTPYAGEPSIPGTFRIFRLGASGAARTVTYTVGGTATAGSDYPALSGSGVLAANASSTTLTITPTNDSAVEGPETVVVTLDPPAGASLLAASAALTILDNDGTARPVVSLRASAAAARESASDGAFTISRTGSTAAALRVLLLPATGTATSGLDYIALPTQVDIPAGQAAVDVPVHVLDDQLAEASETVGLALAASPDYSASTQRTGTVTIADDEPPTVTLAVSDGTATEPGTDTGRWTVTRTGDMAQALNVALAVDGTACAGSDYVSLPASVTIPAGAASATVTLTALDDAVAESDETVILRLLPDPAYRLGGAATGTVTIKDDEAPVLDLIAVDPWATESGDTAKFRVIRRGSLATAITAAIAWSGTAQNGSDVASLPATIALAANAASADITVTPKQDTVLEEMETVVATLQPGAGYAPGQAMATAWLGDDEAGGRVNLRFLASAGWEFDGIPAVIEVFRTGKLSTTITVPYSLSGTAIVHELNPPRQLVLPAGVDHARIILTPLRDERVESDETVIIQLLPGTGYTLGTAPAGTFTVRESPPGSG